MGSIALGSLLITLVQSLKLIVKLLQKHIKEQKCANFISKCCQCCLCCFEGVLIYLSRNAYIEVG